MKSKRAVKELEGKREKLCSQVLRCVWCKEEDLGRWGPGGIVRAHQVVDDRHGEGEERERERERKRKKESGNTAVVGNRQSVRSCPRKRWRSEQQRQGGDNGGERTNYREEVSGK